ncbi:hydantoinase/oxoprolinase family protein [Dactylosporangium fulvum]|uniref:Hydantoinase/oxoprolinase family protein n=1 Tax=Dactylosporangium fulvum TaxID=53359 RepID=A0ABY5W6H4_9ACTN|nr:hydantoinase/oxoprolinase family protein [Dactylosporangium fulvum]UWP85658.1 hydantoinase/oxoprolinase family protein [Dactylosporangium fulvum]
MTSADKAVQQQKDEVLLGVDIGGTFTDIVAVNPRTGEVIEAKTPTTHHGLEEGLRKGIKLIQDAGYSIKSVNHGTTVITNALTEGNLAKTAVLCTRGFRDVLEFKRLWRERLFGYDWERPDALVPRDLRFEVAERIGAEGQVVVALDEDEVRSIARKLREEEVAAVAVTFLFSFKNPAHERRTVEILAEELPDIPVSASADILPEIHEYERAATTTVNALVRPVIAGYLDRVSKTLAEIGVSGPLRMVRSDGALMTPKAAQREPFRLINSGPSAGVIGANLVGREEGWDRIITMDMGGTTTDVALIWDGVAQRSRENDVLWNTPVRASQVDIRSIGAGGGSIIGLDATGLYVGPRSAGSMPGPACYGHGGTNATVVDALLVLGALPVGLARDTLRLDVEASRQALINSMPGYASAEEAALAVYEVTLSKMALLIREMTVNRGYDPRECVLMCFGGAGGAFAVDLAEHLGIEKVCLPPASSVFSAFGAARSRPVSECIIGISERRENLTDNDVTKLFKQVEGDVRARMADENESVVDIEFEIDVKYRSQPETLTVPVENTGDAPTATDAAIAAFHSEHTRLYHLDRSDEAVEIVLVRARALGAESEVVARVSTHGTSAEDPAATSPSRTWHRPGKSHDAVEVVSLSAMPEVVNGPAFLQDENTTIAVPPGSRATRSPKSGAVILEVGA